MESGTPGQQDHHRRLAESGAAADKDAVSPVRAVSLGPELPRALRGHNEAVAINNLNEFKVSDPARRPTFESMYAATHDKC